LAGSLCLSARLSSLTLGNIYLLLFILIYTVIMSLGTKFDRYLPVYASWIFICRWLATATWLANGYRHLEGVFGTGLPY
jgi:hypothetical protein